MSGSGEMGPVSEERENREGDLLPIVQKVTSVMKARGRWPYLILIGLVLMVYANGLGNSFSSSDDYSEILENTNLSSLHGLATYFHRSVIPGPSYPAVDETSYRPLVWVRRAIERALWGRHPFGYHVTNVLLHALNACLVYRILSVAFGRPGPALASALIWALHPINTQAVIWISGGQGPTLCLFFALLALRRFLAATQTSARWRFGPPLLFALALLSYELVVILPVLALLLDTAIARQHGEPAWARLRRHWRLHLGFWAVLLGYLLLRSLLLGFGSSVTLPGLARKMGPRLLRVPQGLAGFLLLFLAPLRLTNDRDLLLSAARTFWEPAVLLSTLVLLCFVAVTWWLGRRSPLALFGGLWFWLVILPVSNILPLYRAFSEHHLYLPAIGLATLSVAGVVFATDRLARVRPSLPWRRYTVVLLLLVLVGAGVRTIVRTRDFADDETLFRATVGTNPKSFRARYNLGLIYLQRDQLEEAIAMFHQALALKPGDVKSLNALALVYLRQGRVQQGIAELEKAVALDPWNEVFRRNLGLARQWAGRQTPGSSPPLPGSLSTVYQHYCPPSAERSSDGTPGAPPSPASEGSGSQSCRPQTFYLYTVPSPTGPPTSQGSDSARPR